MVNLEEEIKLEEVYTFYGQTEPESETALHPSEV
jgi:hypothetical protein